MIEELSFDDEVDEDLYVFSGSDFLTSHYDKADLDWAEVASRTAIDERRGLVITQAVVIEDVIDEFILYLADPPNAKQYRAKPLGTWNAGRNASTSNGSSRAPVCSTATPPRSLRNVEELVSVATDWPTERSSHG
jgi:hypothetical protein